MSQVINFNPVAISSAAYAQKYLSAIGLAVLLYDHLLTLPQEWMIMSSRSSITPTKVLFLFLRYGVLACQLMGAYVISGAVDTMSELLRWFLSTSLIGTISLGMADLIMINRVYVLWDRRTKVRSALLCGFIIFYGITVAFGVANIYMLSGSELIYPTADHDALLSEPNVFHTCFIRRKPNIWSGIWAPQLTDGFCSYMKVAFDCYIVILTVLNAVDRPRQADARIIHDLRRDGGLTFLGIFALRLVNLVLGIYPNVQFSVIAFLLFLRVECLMELGCRGRFGDSESSGFIIQEIHELTVLR
ncbi:uncharacterized protein STEHIDRAFT_112652 [Stereum hirsutum FP-91666 SS1]|uniref:uncharacterized protein n=1 Tax=Stereum hirsutum (strain FP-91666) TaxID=721885 RepID=UPI0004449CE6|nr:uncharacterized protein STEHIDRAFT_112652 [Stereum hirsutum FP-91666 SS1]EIM84213.1 hypothetical protein STEHIDRAFT_112652 [Stereum hirsutum FP-91666 SS1]